MHCWWLQGRLITVTAQETTEYIRAIILMNQQSNTVVYRTGYLPRTRSCSYAQPNPEAGLAQHVMGLSHHPMQKNKKKCFFIIHLHVTSVISCLVSQSGHPYSCLWIRQAAGWEGLTLRGEGRWWRGHKSWLSRGEGCNLLPFSHRN